MFSLDHGTVEEAIRSVLKRERKKITRYTACTWRLIQWKGVSFSAREKSDLRYLIRSVYNKLRTKTTSRMTDSLISVPQYSEARFCRYDDNARKNPNVVIFHFFVEWTQGS